MTEKPTILDLRNYFPSGGLINGMTVQVINYASIGDNGGGIFMWRDDPDFKIGPYGDENFGTIIKSYMVAPFAGSWVRQYDGFINVLYFGAFGYGIDYTMEIQRAIDFAETNAQLNPQVKSSTVYIPNGSYLLSHIELKSGVDIIGESLQNTNIYALKGEDDPNDYLFTIEKGRVTLNISNLNIIGVRTDHEEEIYTLKGCFKFEADYGDFGDGGLWYSNIKNIQIRYFKQNGIYLLGGSGTVKARVNQFNVFENIRVIRHGDGKFAYDNHALKMKGQNGQHSFINCQFDGFHYIDEEEITVYDMGINVMIENGEDITTNVATFLNCTFQEADYGIIIKQAENITIDNCWFEYLGVAITVQGNVGKNPEEMLPSKSINILNSRFANASGFGSINAPRNIKDGQCVSVQNSVVNVYDNFVTASYPDEVSSRSLFVYGFPNNYGLNVYGNTFRKDNVNLRRCFGIKQDRSVDASQILFSQNNRLVFIEGPGLDFVEIKRIESSINPGETLTIRCEVSQVTFYDGDNIFLTNRSVFILGTGEIATFIKIDIGNDNETYQLVSFVKTTP